MSIIQKSMSILSMILGILVNALMFTEVGMGIFGTLIPALLIGTLGLTLSVLSIVFKHNRKWIGILGILLNGIPLAYFAFLYLALG